MCPSTRLTSAIRTLWPWQYLVCREAQSRRQVKAQGSGDPIEVGKPLLWDNRFLLRLQYTVRGRVCVGECA